MIKDKSSYIYLTGGLGNQLFQMAYLMSRDSKYKIAEVSLGLPRSDVVGNPDVFAFRFSEILQVKVDSKHLKLTRKLINYLLRDGLGDVFVSRIPGARKTIRKITSLLISSRLNSEVSVQVADDNGYCSIPQQAKNEFLIGYFQSYRWLSNSSQIFSFMSGLKLINEPDYLTNFISGHRNRSKIAVHVRLGDYLLDSQLGVLDSKYYLEALTLAFSEKQYDEIWLFSNDPDNALNFIPQVFHHKIVVIKDDYWKPAETLELMRHADAYVIANSTLSWWGATLSYSTGAPVLAPNPWFMGKLDPKELIPTHWTQLSVWEKVRP